MISREICSRVLRAAVATGADYAELFAENTINHSIHMIASKVDAINDGVIAGAAVRVYKGLRSVMATTVDTSEAGLIRCAQKAADALGEGTAQIDIVLRERIFGDIHPVKVPFTIALFHNSHCVFPRINIFYNCRHYKILSNSYSHNTFSLCL